MTNLPIGMRAGTLPQGSGERKQRSVFYRLVRNTLPAEKLAAERARIAQLFEASRPHYMIDTIADLPAVVEEINGRLKRGETPQAG